MNVRRTAGSISAALILVWTPVTVAQTDLAEDLLGQAEQALVNVDFPQVAELAQRSIEAGGLSSGRLAHAYALLGQSHAALGNPQEARNAYIRQIALEPDAQVNTNLAPRLRSPFLEARGYWATVSSRLTLEADMDWARGSLRVRFSDPLNLARSLRFTTSVDALSDPVVTRVPPQVLTRLPVPGLTEETSVLYAVTALDEFGNSVAELGSEDQPQVAERPVASAPAPALAPQDRPDAPAESWLAPAASQPAAAESTTDDEARPSRGWLWGVLGFVVAAAGAGVAAYLLTREQPIELVSMVSFR